MVFISIKPMKIPRVELFEWLLNNHERAEYVLAFSKIKGLSKGEYDELVCCDHGSGLDLGRDALYGADEFEEVLAKMYDCGLDNIVTASGGSGQFSRISRHLRQRR